MDTNATDLRGLLSYVPQFRGKLFVIDLEWGALDETAQAEIVMDLCALQSIGVKLLIVSGADELDDFLDWAVEQEFRSSVIAEGASVERLRGVLDRGQAALVRREGGMISPAMVEYSVALGAAKIIALTDTSLIEKNGEAVKFIRVKEVATLSASLVDRQKSLLESSAVACEAGVERVHLLDAKLPGVLLNEIFSSEGVGTMVYTDSYRQIRSLREEDISELLGMIGRSVRRTHLVPRTYEQVADYLQNYAVMEVDGHVVGCVALYEYGDLGEVACLYVKQTHEGTGYGADLVTYMEQEAQKRGIREIFALTNRAARFFTEEMGYQPMAIESLPQERLLKLRNSGRDSLAFSKCLLEGDH